MVKEILVCLSKEELLDKCAAYYKKKSKFQRRLFLVINILSATFFFYFLESYRDIKTDRMLIAEIVSFVVLISSLIVAFMLGKRDGRELRWRSNYLRSADTNLFDVLDFKKINEILKPFSIFSVANMNDPVIATLIILSNFKVTSVLLSESAVEFVTEDDSYEFPVATRISEGFVVVNKDCVLVSNEEEPSDVKLRLRMDKDYFRPVLEDKL